MTNLKTQQRVVLRGILGGILAMLAVIGAVYWANDPLLGMDQMVNRLAYGIACNAFAIVPLFIGIASVGNARFGSAAINPLAGAESERTKIYGRFLTNTLEQFMMFMVATITLSLYLTDNSMRLLPALTANFVVARILFLVGYLKNPLYRSTGFAMTMYPTVICLFYDLYRIVADGVPR